MQKSFDWRDGIYASLGTDTVRSWFDNTRKGYAGGFPAAARRPFRWLTTNGI